MTTIHIKASGQNIRLAPQGYLERDDFERYLSASRDAGCRYDGAGQATSIDHLGRVMSTLSTAGFEVTLDPDLNASIKAVAADAARQVEETEAAMSAAEERAAKNGLRLYPFQRDGVRWLAARDTALLADEMGLGKSQPVDTQVMTPDGYVRIGSMLSGDYVIGSGGKPTRIRAVYPQGMQDTYLVKFSDGSAVEASGDHLWSFDYRKGGRDWARVDMTTEEIPDWSRGKGSLYLPMLSAPVEFSNVMLPIPAYTLGYLIANGGLTGTSAVASAHSDDAYEVHVRMQSEGMDVGAVRNSGDASRFSVRGIMPMIRDLGLDVYSHSKRIPETYLTAPSIDRIALLHGLMDGDGSITATRNRITYHTTSNGLAADVVMLVETLGGIASVRRYDRAEKPTEFQVRIRLPEWVAPFSVDRKASRHNPANRSRPCRTVVGIEYVGKKESVCISVEAEDHLYLTEHCILTHNTIQLLAAIPDGVPAVVICPSGLKGNWLAECRKWRPDLEPVILSGRNGFRWPLLAGEKATILGPQPKPELVIANEETFQPTKKDLQDACKKKGHELRGLSDDQLQILTGKELLQGSPIHGTVLIYDEAHRGKGGAKTQRGRAFREMSKAVLASRGKVWLATGTPLVNKPPELKAVLDMAGLFQEAYGAWPAFVRAFDGRKDGFGMCWGKPTTAAADGLRRVSLRRLRLDVLADLPGKTYQDIDCPVDKKTVKLLDELQGQVTMGRPLSEITLADLKRNIEFENMAKIRAAVARAKVPAALEVVTEHELADEPLIVFSAHRAAVDLIGARPGWARISGSESSEEKTEIVQRFQDGHLRGLALTIRAGGVGITLTRAHRCLFVDLDWTPAGNAQAEDRLCRIGQKSAVQVTRLVADHPMDRLVCELLTVKADIIDNSVEEAARGTQQQAEDLIAQRRKLAESVAQHVAQANAGEAAAAERRATEMNAADALLSLVADIPAGCYLIGDDEVKLDRGQWQWDGWIFFSVNGERAGRIKPDGSAIGDARRLAEAISLDPRGAMESYGKRTGRCGICSRELSDPESVARGIGPICLEKF